MKNLQSYDEFLNESKTFSPKSIKEFYLNKNSVNELKKYAYKIKDDYIKFNNAEYFGSESSLLDSLNNIKEGRFNTFYSDYLYISYKNHVIGLNLNSDDNKNVILGTTRISLPISEAELKIFIDKSNGDVSKGFMLLLDEIFKKYGNEIAEHIEELTSLPILYAIKAGEISPTTGKTGHGWSIYDSPKSILAWGGDSNLLYLTGSLEIGKSYKILNDQTHKVEWPKFTVKELISCNYKDFVNFSKRTGAKIPVGSYQKQPGNFNYTLYSIK